MTTQPYAAAQPQKAESPFNFPLAMLLFAVAIPILLGAWLVLTILKIGLPNNAKVAHLLDQL